MFMCLASVDVGVRRVLEYAVGGILRCSLLVDVDTLCLEFLVLTTVSLAVTLLLIGVIVLVIAGYMI